MRARVIALGQAAAGDDGVGFAVLEALRQRRVPDGVELLQASDASAIISLLETSAPVVLVDAAVGRSPGDVLELSPAELAGQGVQPLSSHGMGLAQAVELAAVLSPEKVSRSIRVVAVTIARPERYGHGLSPVIAAAVPRAAERVLSLIGG